MVKFYKLKRALKKIIQPIYKVLIVVVTFFVVGFVINNLIYGKLVWDTAYRFKNAGEYRAAINLYNYAAKYYKVVKFTKDNRKKYIELQYNKAMCYLGENQPQKADEAIKEGMYLMMDAYGLKSPEYAAYIRNYVVEYYIKRHDFKAAREYLVLAEYLYLQEKTSGNELATINRLYGDLYFEMGDIYKAESYYKNAYRLTDKYKDLDQDAMIAIVDRMSGVYIRKNEHKNAIAAYAKLVDVLTKQNCKDKTKYAFIDWNVAKVYFSEGQYENAITYYNKAYAVIQKLPDYYALSQNINVLRKEMADTYQAIGRYTEAEKLLRKIEDTTKK